MREEAKAGREEAERGWCASSEITVSTVNIPSSLDEE